MQTVTKYLSFKVKPSDVTREIAYRRHEGKPGSSNVIYIPGFMSGKDGNKARALEVFCQKNQLNFTRYDPTGLGETRPIALKDARLSHWIQDAEKVLHLVDEPQILVGSSMGAWISLHLGLRYPDKLKGLILIAPGVNFADRFLANLRKILPAPDIEKLEKGEGVNYAHPEYGVNHVSMDLFNDTRQFELDLNQPLDIQCPIRIIHGVQDDVVPYMGSLKLLQSLKSRDVQLTFIKDGDHRLSTDENLKLISEILFKMVYPLHVSNL